MMENMEKKAGKIKTEELEINQRMVERAGCQDELMEKKRILSIIDDAVELNGLKVMDGDNDSVIVRVIGTNMDFEIYVKLIPE